MFSKSRAAASREMTVQADTELALYWLTEPSITSNVGVVCASIVGFAPTAGLAYETVCLVIVVVEVVVGVVVWFLSLKV